MICSGLILMINRHRPVSYTHLFNYYFVLYFVLSWADIMCADKEKRCMKMGSEPKVLNIFKRYELKYLLNDAQYSAVMRAMEEKMRGDEYGKSDICNKMCIRDRL